MSFLFKSTLINPQVPVVDLYRIGEKNEVLNLNVSKTD